MKKALAGGVAALTIAGGSFVVGVLPALAQDSDDPATVLDGLVDEGVITQDQADAVGERFQQWREERPFPGRFGRGPGRGAFGDSETRQEILDVLGIDETELQERLAAGETLAEVAGDDLDTIVDLLVAEAQEHLDAAVEAGRLTEEEATEKSADLEARITERLESEMPFRGGHRGRRGHHHDRFGDTETDDGSLEDSSLTTA